MAEVRTIRADDETMSKLKAITEEMGCSQGQALGQLVQMWEGQQLRQLVPGRGDELDAYEAALGRLRELYQGSLSMYAEAQQRAQEAVSKQMDGLQRAVAELGDRCKQSEAQRDKLVGDMSALKGSLDSLKRERDQMRETLDLQTAAIAEKDGIIKGLRANLSGAQEQVADAEALIAQVADLQTALEAEQSARRQDKLDLEAARLKAEQDRLDLQARHQAEVAAVYDRVREAQEQAGALISRLQAQQSQGKRKGNQGKQEAQVEE